MIEYFILNEEEVKEIEDVSNEDINNYMEWLREFELGAM